MTLTVVDLGALLKYDRDLKKLNFFDAAVVSDPKTPLRLQKAGLVNDKGFLTHKGLEKVGILEDKEKVLKAGLPLKARKKADPKALLQKETPWATGSIAKKPYFTNGLIWIIGKPEREMKAETGSPELRHSVPPMLSQSLAGKLGDFEGLTPYAWSYDELGGMEMIWLKDNKGEMTVPVQAVFFDFIKSRYPSGKYICRKGKEESAVVVRVSKRGVKHNAVALIMPVVKDGKPIPSFKE